MLGCEMWLLHYLTDNNSPRYNSTDIFAVKLPIKHSAVAVYMYEETTSTVLYNDSAASDM